MPAKDVVTDFITSEAQANAIFEILEERRAQGRWWRTGRAVEEQYKFAAPHILVLEGQLEKLRANWYGATDESSLRERFVKVAAIALRALEEISVTK